MITGDTVDLVEPYPVEESTRVHQWLRASGSISRTDQFPQDVHEFTHVIQNVFPQTRSWGVIDKYRVSGHDIPLIGVLIFEPIGLMGGRTYCASARIAWGKGLMDEAGALAIDQVFNDDPRLQYIIGMVLQNNAPAKSFNTRLGLKLKNVLPDYTKSGDKLQDMLVYEMTREDWTALRKR